MNHDEAVRIVREQTIPSLRGSGGGWHVEALEALIAGTPRRRDLERQAKRQAETIERLTAERDAAQRRLIDREEETDLLIKAEEEKRQRAEAALAEARGKFAHANTVRIPQAFEEGVASVLMIRCVQHRAVPQYNRNEANGGECPACEVESLRAALAARDARVALMGRR